MQQTAVPIEKTLKERIRTAQEDIMERKKKVETTRSRRYKRKLSNGNKIWEVKRKRTAKREIEHPIKKENNKTIEEPLEIIKKYEKTL